MYNNGQILSRTIRCPYSSTTTTDEQTIKGASIQVRQQPEKEMITICKKEYQDLLDNKCANVIKQEVRKSMAASYQANGINPAQLIHNFITNRIDE